MPLMTPAAGHFTSEYSPSNKLQPPSARPKPRPKTGARRRRARLVWNIKGMISELVVGAVAARPAAGGLAAAEPDFLAGRRLEEDGFDAGPGMGAVAEGLFRAAPASAPEIFAPR